MHSLRLGTAVVSLTLLLACGHAPPAPDAPEAAAYYRQRLADSPKGQPAVEYHDALESAEFANAKRTATILGYRTFLSEFPDGAHQREARTLLESLRWNEASAIGTEAALQGFLADEPRGAHAKDAWARIARLQLTTAVTSKDAPLLRAWLAAHPDLPGRDQAGHALEEAEFREAAAAPLHQRRAALQAFLEAHPDGAKRAEAESLEAQAAVDEAALLEDADELRAWARSGREDARKKLAELAFDDAASRLALAQLEELSHAQKGPDAFFAERAKDLAARLRRLGARANPLVEAARALYLPAPRPELAELPSDPRERAKEVRELALSLDGRALPQLLAELGSPHAFVAEAALESSLHLLSSLPKPEAQLRAARAAEALRPIAQDGPHLSALALTLVAQEDIPGALAAARAAAARDPRSLVSQMVATRLEAVYGDRSLAAISARALAAAARSSLAARPEISRVPGASVTGPGDASPTLWALCAAELAARDAVRLLAAPAPPKDPGKEPAPPEASQEDARKSAREDARAVLATAERTVVAAERAAHKEGACHLERDSLSRAIEAREAVRAKAAALLKDPPADAVSREAIERASRRDPSPDVRIVLELKPWESAIELPAPREDRDEKPAPAPSLAPPATLAK